MTRSGEAESGQLVAWRRLTLLRARGDVLARLGRLLDVGVAVRSAGAGWTVKTAGEESTDGYKSVGYTCMKACKTL